MAKFTDAWLVALAERNRVKNSKIDIWNRHSPVSLGVQFYYLDDIEDEVEIELFKRKRKQNLSEEFHVWWRQVGWL